MSAPRQRGRGMVATLLVALPAVLLVVPPGVLLLGATRAMAADPALLRATVAPTAPVWVGQRAPIDVTLLTAGTFAGAPVFELPRIPGAVLMRMSDHPVLGTETIDGVEYTVQHHDLALFAMRPGVFDVPPFAVRVAFTPALAAPPVQHRLTTPPLRIDARMPPGAENLPGLVSTTALTLDATWSPATPAAARVGDAFTRTITRSAPDVPGMVFPPLPAAAPDGLAAYPRPAVVRDRSERGEFTGTRIEAVTYVCERPGRVTLPALAVPWWDVEHQTLETATVPAVTFEVGRAPMSPVARRWLAGLAGVTLLLVGIAAWRGRHALRAAWRRRRAWYEASERGRFAHLEHTCRGGDAAAAYNALLAWLGCLHPRGGPATIEDDLLARQPDPELRRRVGELEAVVLGGATDWDGGALAGALRRARRALRARERPAGIPSLPALNPP